MELKREESRTLINLDSISNQGKKESTFRRREGKRNEDNECMKQQKWWSLAGDGDCHFTAIEV